MGIKVNLTGVEAGYTPLPPGDYSGRIKSITQQLGKDSGQPYLAVAVALDPTPDGKVKKGRQVFTNVSLQEKSLWAVKTFLLNLGKSEEETAGELEIEPAEFIGMPVVARLGPPDNGFNNNKVTGVYSEGNPRLTAATSRASAGGDNPLF